MWMFSVNVFFFWGGWKLMKGLYFPYILMPSEIETYLWTQEAKAEAVLGIFSSVQSLSRVWLSVTPWTAACLASLSITNSWSLLKLMFIDLLVLSNHLILCHTLLLRLQSFLASGSFLVTSDGQSIGASALTSVLPMNIQNWFPLGWTGWISLQFKGLSRVFPTPQFKSINFSVLSFLYDPILASIHNYWKKHSFD